MPSVLITSFHPIFQDYKSGGEERVYLLSQALAEAHDTSILSIGLTDRLDIVQHGQVTEYRLSKSEFLSAYAIFAKRYGGYLSLPSATAAFSNPKILAEILRLNLDPDIVLHQYPNSSSLVKFYNRAAHVYHSNNFETKLCSQLIYELDDAEPNLETPDPRLVIADHENFMVDQCTLVTATTETDQKFFQALSPQREILISENCIQRPRMNWRQNTGEIKLMFFGSAHPPNVIAAKSLVEQLKKEHLAELVFAGPVCSQIPDGPWRRLGTLPLEKLESELCDGAIFVNPIFHGSGSSLKAAKAAALGVPILSTQLGMRGFPQDTYLSFKDFEELNSHLDKIVSSDDKATPLYRSALLAKKFALSNLTYQVVLKNLLDNLNVGSQ